MESPCALSLIVVGPFTLFTVGVVVLLTWCYVYYAAGSFTVWYVVLRGTCTVGQGFFFYNVEFLLYRGRTVICGCLFYPCGGVFYAAV